MYHKIYKIVNNKQHKNKKYSYIYIKVVYYEEDGTRIQRLFKTLELAQSFISKL